MVPVRCHRVRVVQKGYEPSQWSCCVCAWVNMESLAASSCVSSAQPWPLDPHKSDEQRVLRSLLVLALKKPGEVRLSPSWSTFLLSAQLRLTKTYNKFSDSHDLSLSASSNQYLKALLLSHSRERVFKTSQGTAAHRSVNTWHWLMHSQRSFMGFTVMLHHKLEGINSACVTLRESGASTFKPSALQCAG